MTTETVFRVDGVLGKAAVFTVDSSNPTDLTPFTAPRSNLSKVKFHTDFTYPRIVQDTTVSVSLGGVTAPARLYQQYQLFAHGLSGTPLIFGAYYNLTYGWCSLGVGVPMGSYLSLGANSTYVLLQQLAIPFSNGTVNSTISAQTLSVRVLVTDQLL